MEKLFEISVSNIRNQKLTFQRQLLNEIDWNNRLIAILGARGVGKTTLLLQHIKRDLQINESIIYVSLDNIYFSDNKLYDFADRFVKNGGKYLFLDEIHKYKNWSSEIKNIYDNFPELSIVITGSSILDIYDGSSDLSRRAVHYDLDGMSFSEYLIFENKLDYPRLELEKILENHIAISSYISAQLKPLAEFRNYLKFGYYPFYKENKDSYHQKLANVINVVLENDLPALSFIEYKSVIKLKKLLYIIAQSVPFRANISNLSQRLEISRNTIIIFLEYLEKAKIISFLNSAAKGYGYLSKPEKIYLNNTNIIYALAEDNGNLGNIRETFFMNQLRKKHQVNFSVESDFLIDNSLTFEVGGANKTSKQITGLKCSYIAKDDIEVGYKHTIPLWLFGFLY